MIKQNTIETALGDIKVVVDHKDFLVINKPAGISVHKDQNDLGFLTALSQALNVNRLYLVHRLDQMTSGLLILAKNTESNQTLSQMFEERSVTKYYLALSNQKPKKKQGLIKGDMVKSRGGSWKLLKSKDNPAVTQFFSFGISLSTANAMKGLRLYLLKPKTGKTHQLRVALKSLGAPILGDERYFPKVEKGKSEVLSSSNTADSIWHVDRGYLHAWRLIFVYQGEAFDVSDLPQTGCLFCDEGMTRFLSDLGHPNELDWPLV